MGRDSLLVENSVREMADGWPGGWAVVFDNKLNSTSRS